VHCRIDRPFHCDHIVPLKFDGKRADGSRPISLDGSPITSAFFQQSTFATHANVPARNLVVVDHDTPRELLAALPCGVMTGTGAVANVLRAEKSDAFLIAGAGAVGLAALMTAKRLGVRRIVAIDIHPGRLSLARELGAHHVIDGLAGDLSRQLRAIEPRGFDAVFDTTGRASVIATLIDHLTMGARLALVTTPPPSAEPAFPLEALFYRAATLHNVIVGLAVPQRVIPKLLEWYRAGEFPVDRLVRCFPFEQIEDACAAMAAGAVIKPVLTMT
jgi:aryl-alcohol dehydrogenase